MTCHQCSHVVARLCGRGLCRPCWKRAQAAGTLDDFSLPRRTAAELIADVEWIVGTDTAESIAKRLGYMRVRTLLELLHRNNRPDLAQRLRGVA